MRGRPHVSRTLATIIVFLVAAFTYPGAVATSMLVALTPAPSGSSPAPSGALPWLHVEHPSGAVPYIADDKGRMVLLHGVTPQGLIDFYSSTDPSRVDLRSGPGRKMETGASTLRQTRTSPPCPRAGACA